MPVLLNQEVCPWKHDEEQALRFLGVLKKSSSQRAFTFLDMQEDQSAYSFTNQTEPMCRFVLGCYSMAAAVGTDAPESIGEFVKKALFFVARLHAWLMLEDIFYNCSADLATWLQ